MNRKKQELTDLTNKLENKLIMMDLIGRIIKVGYMIFSISAITTMVIGVIFKMSNIYSLAFWLLFLVFILFFVEKFINNNEPTLKNNIKYLKEYAIGFDLENNKINNPISKKKK